MINVKTVLILLVAIIGIAVVTAIASEPILAGPPGPPGPPDGHRLVTICHQPGTPAQKTMDVPGPAVAGHLRHGDTLGPCVPPPPPCPLSDTIIDADGAASAGTGLPGAQDAGLLCGAPLSSFPAFNSTGLDWFDNDGDAQWTLGPGGDDLHTEDPITCPGALRDGIHQLGLDCVVLDLDGSLFNGQPVDCDLEVDFSFSLAFVLQGGCSSALTDVRYFDANLNGVWDDGEDIVLDANGNAVFD